MTATSTLFVDGSPVSSNGVVKTPVPGKLFRDVMIVDPEVQRTVDPNWVAIQLKEGFDPTGLGAITVSARKDGTYAVIDGQHRVELCKRADYQQPLDCMIWKGLTQAQEAAMFLKLNKRRGVQPIARFLVRVKAGEETSVILTGLLAKYGWRVQATKSKGAFSAVSSFEHVYEGWGKVPAKNLGACESVISTITGAWGLEAHGTRNEIITGLGRLFIRHGNKVDISKLVSELASTEGGPQVLVGSAKSLSRVSSGTVGDAMAAILVNLHNKGRRTEKHKLPSWLVTG